MLEDPWLTLPSTPLYPGLPDFLVELVELGNALDPLYAGGLDMVLRVAESRSVYPHAHGISLAHDTQRESRKTVNISTDNLERTANGTMA